MTSLARFVVLIVGWLAVPFSAIGAEPPPNILFILVDDLAWSDLACYGHPWHHTPHLDGLAKEGMWFTQAYAPAPICSASRAAILTGKTPARLHFEFVTKGKPGSQSLQQPLQSPPYPTNLPLTETTTAEMLSPTGYRTAYYGKWHLNMHSGGYLGWSATHGPLQQGFAEGSSDFGGHPYAYDAKGDRGDLALQEGEFPPDSLTDRVIAHLQRKTSDPFLLQWSTYYVHDPIHTRNRWLFDKYRRRLPADLPDDRAAYAAMVETLDHEIGRVLTALDASEHARNTVVVFMSDNGGHPVYTRNGPLRGSKWNLFEGGIRVPLIVRWPGRTPAGSVCEQPVHGCDLAPTFAELAGAKIEAVDGLSLAPLLTAPDRLLPERPLFWHFPYYHPETRFNQAPAQIGVNDPFISQTRPHSAVRLGRHKLIHFTEDDRDELYDLVADPSESNDLTAAQPERTAHLRHLLLQELKTSNAREAVPKP